MGVPQELAKHGNPPPGGIVGYIYECGGINMAQRHCTCESTIRLGFNRKRRTGKKQLTSWAREVRSSSTRTNPSGDSRVQQCKYSKKVLFKQKLHQLGLNRQRSTGNIQRTSGALEARKYAARTDLLIHSRVQRCGYYAVCCTSKN